MSYHVGTQSIVAIPIYVRHSLTLKSGEQGRLDITVGPKTTLGRTVEGELNLKLIISWKKSIRFIPQGVKIEICMPKSVLNCSLVSTQGKYSFDPVAKILHWDVGRIDVSKLPNIRGSVCLADCNNPCTRLSKRNFFFLSGGRSCWQYQLRLKPLNQCAIQYFTACCVRIEGEPTGYVR
jgi:AP-3 complex subunit mu